MYKQLTSNIKLSKLGGSQVSLLRYSIGRPVSGMIFTCSYCLEEHNMCFFYEGKVTFLVIKGIKFEFKFKEIGFPIESFKF